MSDQFQPSEAQIAAILGRQHSKRQMAIAYLRASHERNQLRRSMEIRDGLDRVTEKIQARDFSRASAFLDGVVAGLKNGG